MTNDRKARAARAEQMRKEREKADRKQRNIISIAIVAVVVVLLGVAAWGISSISEANKKSTEVIEPRNLVDSGVPYIPADDVEVAENAPVVEVFVDFLCPACAQFEATMGPVLKQAAAEGTIDLRFKPFAFLHNNSTNEYARRAMNIAMCVADQEGSESFWDIEAALFAIQPQERGPGPSDEALLEMAEGAGVTGLDECVNKEKFVPWIDEIKDEFAKERNVTGTPTLHINGEESDARSPEAFAAAIAAASK